MLDLWGWVGGLSLPSLLGVALSLRCMGRAQSTETVFSKTMLNLFLMHISLPFICGKVSMRAC